MNKKENKLINALHNTIDFYKEDITKLLKEGTSNLKLSFKISPFESISFNIECDKCATLNFNKLIPFTYEGLDEGDD